MLSISKNKIVILLIILFVVFSSGASCQTATQKAKNNSNPLTLIIWRPYDDITALDELTKKYKSVHPNVSFEIKKIRYAEYENFLLNSLAEDKGPDIFSIPSTWLGKYASKVVPLPTAITLPYTVTSGTVKKTVSQEMRTKNMLTTKQVKNIFLDVVSDDAVRQYQANKDSKPEDRILGLPLALDTMVLFYNRDLLDSVSIANPPYTWSDFQKEVKMLTKADASGAIIQSGGAIGRGDNISRSPDLLSLLMMQNGATMIDKSGKVSMNLMPANLSGNRDLPPGEEALIFYTDYARSDRDVYTWNEKMPASLEAFMSGQTAFFFGYSYNESTIKTLAPKLNYGVSSMLQIPGNPTINFARYSLEVVSSKSKYSDWAWDFISFATAETNVKNYLEKVQRPTALRNLVDAQKEDENLAVYANQLLTAKSWYHGVDAPLMEEIMINLIDGVIAKRGEEKFNLKTEFRLAVDRINQTIE